MRRRLTKDQILTIPNAMSAFRLLLIPFIVWTFREGKNYVSVGLVVLSAVTDMFDGAVARRFNMVSDLGKILDPIADKLTQAALLFCLLSLHRCILYLLMLLVFKEALMSVLGGITIKKRNAVHSAQWHGKLCTVVFECTMIALMLFRNIDETVVYWLLLICACVMTLSLVLYIIYFVGFFRKKI